MLNSKSLFLALGSVCLFGAVGLSGVQAQDMRGQSGTQQPQSSSTTSSPSTDASRGNDQSAAAPKTRNDRRAQQDRVICKREEILGTRLKSLSTCRTASEWRRVSRGFQGAFKTTNDKAAAAYSTN